MPSRHAPGYRARWMAAHRAADKRLRDDYPKKWRRYFDEEWAARWPEPAN